MSTPSRVELKILGQTLAVRTEASPEYLRSLVAYVEDRVAVLHQSGVKDPMTALSLAALDMADEIFKHREERQKGEVDVRTRLDALVALLERVTPSGETP